jgi:hypothetical protein
MRLPKNALVSGGYRLRAVVSQIDKFFAEIVAETNTGFLTNKGTWEIRGQPAKQVWDGLVEGISHK